MEQLQIDPPAARRSDPHTSHAAAQSIPSLRLSESRIAVLALLRERGPLTDEGLAFWYDRMRAHRSWPLQSPSGLRTRRAELAGVDLVFDSGRRERLKSGRQGVVWCARAAA